MRNIHRAAVLSGLALTLVAASGCATKKFVRQETATVGQRVDQVQGQVEDVQSQVRTHDGRLEGHDRQIGELSKTAQEALARAQEAGKLAEGKFLFETVLTDDRVRFGFNRSELSPEASAALDEFANQLKQEDRSVYVEIQGHTDSVGSSDYNEELGLSRAEAVRVYLNRQHQFPLHRINVISYGETAPVADNETAQGRANNRRVALVVLR